MRLAGDVTGKKWVAVRSESEQMNQTVKSLIRLAADREKSLNCENLPVR